MFRVWGRLIKENHMVKDTTVELPGSDISRTHKVYKALEMICDEMDLAVPIWLDANKREFIEHDRTYFRAVNFMEDIDFDYLDFNVIEEDHIWE